MISHHSPVEEKRDVQDMLTEERVSYHAFMDDPWRPSERSWTNDSGDDVFEVLCISEPYRDVT